MLFLGHGFRSCIGVFPLLSFERLDLCAIGFVMEYFGFSIFIVYESFVGYGNLGWHWCSISVCITTVQDLLAFMVSGEKSRVILIGLPLYVTRPFSLTPFNILS